MDDPVWEQRARDERLLARLAELVTEDRSLDKQSAGLATVQKTDPEWVRVKALVAEYEKHQVERDLLWAEWLEHQEPASAWSRLRAFVVDVVCFGVVYALYAVWFSSSPWTLFVLPILAWVLVIKPLAFPGNAEPVGFRGQDGQTAMGMGLFHIRLVTVSGRPLSPLACAARLLIAVCSGPLLLAALLREDRRAFHDVLFDTVVIRIPTIKRAGPSLSELTRRLEKKR